MPALYAHPYPPQGQWAANQSHVFAQQQQQLQQHKEGEEQRRRSRRGQRASVTSFSAGVGAAGLGLGPMDAIDLGAMAGVSGVVDFDQLGSLAQSGAF